MSAPASKQLKVQRMEQLAALAMANGWHPIEYAQRLELYKGQGKIWIYLSKVGAVLDVRKTVFVDRNEFGHAVYSQDVGRGRAAAERLIKG